MKTTVFACVFLLESAEAFAGPDWSNDNTVRHAAFCVAAFEYRADLAARWSAGGPALLDINSAERIMAIAERHDRAFCYTGGQGTNSFDGALRGPYYPGCGITVSDLKYTLRMQIQTVYEESGLAGAFPPTCMEDPTCTACRDFLRTLHD